MVNLKAAWLSQEGLTDVGYQLFVGNTPVGSRITTGITDTGDGWYEAYVTIPENFVGHLFWNSLSHPEYESREYISISDSGDNLTLNILTIIAHDAVTEKPIRDAVVRAESNGQIFTSKTDVSGMSQLGLPSGSYVVSIIKDGYAFITRNIQIIAASSSVFEVYPISVDSGRLKLAEQIWRDAQLPDDTLSFMTDEDAIQWLATQILPEVESYVDAKLNYAVMPYTYPIETVIIQQAYPNQTFTYASQLSSSWADSRVNVIKFMCLYRIFLMADSLKKEYLYKAEAFKRAADDILTTLISSLQGIVLQVTAGGRKFGFVYLKLPKSRKQRGEFYNY